mmetsp:Transcript_14746/g.25182  ORF Transcript_14746/g.25182 Transcript_14746/m.25182 type:complete len:118 (-) Transcript_14746:74-427(-)
MEEFEPLGCEGIRAGRARSGHATFFLEGTDIVVGEIVGEENYYIWSFRCLIIARDCIASRPQGGHDDNNECCIGSKRNTATDNPNHGAQQCTADRSGSMSMQVREDAVDACHSLFSL